VVMISHITYSMVGVGLAYKQGKSADTWHRQLTFDARGGWQGGSVFGFPAAPIHEQNVLDLQIFSHHTRPRQSMFRISIACDNQMFTAGGVGVYGGEGVLSPVWMRCIDRRKSMAWISCLRTITDRQPPQPNTTNKTNDRTLTHI
jgi:hypothetical protein